MQNLKMTQQTSEYNKKEAGLQIQRTNQWLPAVGAATQGQGRGSTDYQVQNRLKGVLDSTGDLAIVCNNVNGKYPLKLVQHFLGGTVDENPPANAGDMGSIPGWEDSTFCEEPLSLFTVTTKACVPQSLFSSTRQARQCKAASVHCNWRQPSQQ